MKLTHKTSSSHSSPKGFTLIELIIVMAIVAVLATISAGPIMRYFSRGKIVEIQSNFRMMDIAMTDFYEEYRELPYSGDPVNEDTAIVLANGTGDILAALMGLDDTLNEKNNVYLKMKIANNGINGIILDADDKPAGLYDHWKNPYVICLDYDGDGNIQKSQLNEIFESEKLPTVKSSTLIGATPGEDQEWGEVDVTSWQK